MMEKIILCPDRVRKITGTFGFIEHRFLQEGFFYTLSHHELSLYLFLVLVGDRNRPYMEYLVRLASSLGCSDMVEMTVGKNHQVNGRGIEGIEFVFKTKFIQVISCYHNFNCNTVLLQ